MTHGDDDSPPGACERIWRGVSHVAPAGYEAALVAAQLDADVTVVEADGAGGACVLHDCVPSKTFIASSEVVTGYRHNDQFGIRSPGLSAVTVDAVAVHDRYLDEERVDW